MRLGACRSETEGDNLAIDGPEFGEGLPNSEASRSFGWPTSSR